ESDVGVSEDGLPGDGVEGNSDNRRRAGIGQEGSSRTSKTSGAASAGVVLISLEILIMLGIQDRDDSKRTIEVRFIGGPQRQTANEHRPRTSWVEIVG